MCYSGACYYENYYGECTKPRNMPCPDDDEDVAAWEEAREARARMAEEWRRTHEGDAE